MPDQYYVLFSERPRPELDRKNALQSRRADGLGDDAPGLAPALAQLVTAHDDILLCEGAVLNAYEIPAGELAPPGADEPVAVEARIAVDLYVT